MPGMGGVEVDGSGGVMSRLLALAWPIVLSRIGIQMMGVCDAVVVGRYSARELGFHALGWAPTSVVLVAGIGLLGGVQVVTSRSLGEGRPERAGAALRRGIVYAFWLGLASSAALAVGGPVFLHAMSLDPDLTAGASRTLRVFSISLTPYLLACVCTFWLEGLARPGFPLAAMWAANVVNLGFDVVLVPGGFGVPALGAVGAACAPPGARTAPLGLRLAHTAPLPDAGPLCVFVRPARDPAGERMQRRIGYGAGVSYFAEAGAFSGMNIVAGWISPLAVAAWAIVLNVAAIIFMVPLGIAGATSVLVGAAAGARDAERVRRSALAGYGLATGFALVVALAVWPSARWVATAFASDPRLIAAAGAALALAAAFFAPDALQVVAAQSLRARGDVTAPTVIHTLCYAAVMLPLGWALAHPAHLGLTGVVWAVIVASYLVAGLLLLRFLQLVRRDRPA